MTQTLRLAFIKAGWHADIVNQAHRGFVARILEIAPDTQVDTFDVPGAFEMPLQAQRLAGTGTYHAIAAAALVVDGGIYRHDFVAQAVVSGLMDVQLKTDVPVLSISLTPHNFQPGAAHEDFFHAHFLRKGREAADAALAVATGRHLAAI
jgi:6,7-dimethyl-8-ribityllumazine synthase